MASVVANKIGVDIYEVLEACTTDELAPMVNALTKATVSFLKLTRAYVEPNSTPVCSYVCCLRGRHRDWRSARTALQDEQRDFRRGRLLISLPTRFSETRPEAGAPIQSVA